MARNPMTGPLPFTDSMAGIFTFTDVLIPRRHVPPDLAAKQSRGGRKPRQCFGGLTYGILPTNKQTTQAELLEWLDEDILYNTWFNKLHNELGIKTFGIVATSDKAAIPQSKFEDSQIQLKEFKDSARAIHKAFETYKSNVRKYKILGREFLRLEVRRVGIWQEILVDMIIRFEDLLELGTILAGKNREWPLPLPFLKNVWYGFGWLKVAWREINACHVFLKDNYLEDDGSFGDLRDPAPQLGASSSRASSVSSEDDAFSRTTMRANASIRHSKTVVARLKKLGSKMRK